MGAKPGFWYQGSCRGHHLKGAAGLLGEDTERPERDQDLGRMAFWEGTRSIRDDGCVKIFGGTPHALPGQPHAHSPHTRRQVTRHEDTTQSEKQNTTTQWDVTASLAKHFTLARYRQPYGTNWSPLDN